jgi:hypothetical protein
MASQMPPPLHPLLYSKMVAITIQAKCTLYYNVNVLYLGSEIFRKFSSFSISKLRFPTILSVPLLFKIQYIVLLDPNKKFALAV